MKRISQQVEAEHRYAPPAKRTYYRASGDPVSAEATTGLKWLMPLVQLPYEIHKWSSYYPGFHPRNIVVDAPRDTSSRWMTSSNVPPQYIIVKLQQPAIVHTVKFSKSEEDHVCRLRYAKVYGGLREDQMVELGRLHFSHDSEPEHFDLTCDLACGCESCCMPCQYIKIVPLQGYDCKFHFTIWHVEFLGVVAPAIVGPAQRRLDKYLDDEAMKLCMKFLRDNCHSDVLEKLMDSTGTSLEDESLTLLHRELVVNRDFAKAEELVRNAAENGLFDSYISQNSGTLRWTAVRPVASHGETTKDDLCWPSGRGGHDMCIDSENGFAYLFGGWDGRKDLGDLWRLNTSTLKWECLSANTKDDGGPGPRSCHRICIDAERQHLYVLGCFYGLGNFSTDPDALEQLGLQIVPKTDSDFYRYNIVSGEWTKLSSNTGLDNGPPCLFDHQMCYDSSRHVIYVFGGRFRLPVSLPAKQSKCASSYGGLYSYDVRSGTWKELRGGSEDCQSGEESGKVSDLLGRVCHGMVVAPYQDNAGLFVFGGQRGDAQDPSGSFQCYRLEEDTVDTLNPIPSPTFEKPDELTLWPLHHALSSGAHHCIYDPERREIRVSPSVIGGDMLSCTCFNTQQGKRMHNFLWAFSLDHLQWEWLLDVEDPGPGGSSDETWPRPRSMYSMVYDTKSKVHYVFGGRDFMLMNDRLDDLWKLTIDRPNRQELLHRIILDIRKLCCLQIALTDLPSAIQYLRAEVSPFINRDNSSEVEELHELCTTIFEVANEHLMASSIMFTTDFRGYQPKQQQQRCALFDQISSFFPKDFSGPRASLKDVLVIDKNAIYERDSPALE